jgi:hypothetical protein
MHCKCPLLTQSGHSNWVTRRRERFYAPARRYAVLMGVGIRENQKHDRRSAKEHYSTRNMVLVSTL